LCPARWLNEQSITKHWFQSVRTCPYSWATGRNNSTVCLLTVTVLHYFCEVVFVRISQIRLLHLSGFSI